MHCVPVYLSESSWRCRPALVQDVLGQVPVQVHEERVANVIQEILVLWTALLVAVDEALDEPESELSWGVKGIYTIYTTRGRSSSIHANKTVYVLNKTKFGGGIYWTNKTCYVLHVHTQKEIIGIEMFGTKQDMMFKHNKLSFAF